MIYKNKEFKLLILLQIISFLIFSDNGLYSQNIYPASPANWMYPEGNRESTRRVQFRSGKQAVDSFAVKWSSAAIAGDVQPLIGNIINNNKISQNFPYAPNEIVALIGGKIIMLDAYGKIYYDSLAIPYANKISALIDTNMTKASGYSTLPLYIGIEGIEHGDNGIATAYLASFDSTGDSMKIRRRLAVNLNEYSPNSFGSLQPVFGKKIGSYFYIYSSINLSSPYNSDNPLPYFRGFAQFKLDNLDNYPGPDAGDDTLNRFLIGPATGFAPPSITYLNSSSDMLLLPNYPDTSSNGVNFNSTFNNEANLLELNISTQNITEPIIYSLSSNKKINGNRPQIRSYFLNMKNAGIGGKDTTFILVAENYLGIDSSFGNAMLHLFRADGTEITDSINTGVPQFPGMQNQIWSVAIGDVDGNSQDNKPYFRNNKGNELIVTNSSKDLAVPGSRLSILRYDSVNTTPKLSPPNTNLYQFDTIVTQKINGWVAAVNDLDSNLDGKDEIVLANGSQLLVLHLKDYNNSEFLAGFPFDTLFKVNFKNQVIRSVEIADIEGDGLNDIIVTTYDSTYIIGTQIANTLTLLNQKTQHIPNQEFCTGDSISFTWTNSYADVSDVNVMFHPYFNGNPIDTLIPVKLHIKNKGDTVSTTCIIDSSFAGIDGRFIIGSSANIYRVSDSSAIFTINRQDVFVNSLPSNKLFGGSETIFTGTASCVDSVSLIYKLDTTSWVKLNSSPILNNGKFTLSGVLPCSSITDCSSKLQADTIKIAILAITSGYIDTSYQKSFILLPKPLPINFDTTRVAGSAIDIRWNSADVDGDSVNISISINGGNTFSLLATESRTTEHYLFAPPKNQPDSSVVLRLCVPSTCQMTDTILKYNSSSAYTNIVAPNPFNPLTETLQFIYTVQQDATVKIRIFDQNNKVVSQLESGIFRSAGETYTEVWDGKIYDGSYAANGMYYLCIEYSSGTKEVYPVFVRK